MSTQTNSLTTGANKWSRQNFARTVQTTLKTAITTYAQAQAVASDTLSYMEEADC